MLSRTAERVQSSVIKRPFAIIEANWQSTYRWTRLDISRYLETQRLRIRACADNGRDARNSNRNTRTRCRLRFLSILVVFAKLRKFLTRIVRIVPWILFFVDEANRILLRLGQFRVKSTKRSDRVHRESLIYLRVSSNGHGRKNIVVNVSEPLRTCRELFYFWTMYPCR